jgi:hypothetical protein
VLVQKYTVPPVGPVYPDGNVDVISIVDEPVGPVGPWIPTAPIGPAGPVGPSEPVVIVFKLQQRLAPK